MDKKRKSLVGWIHKEFFSINVDRIYGEIYLNGVYHLQKDFFKAFNNETPEPIKVRITIEEL